MYLFHTFACQSYGEICGGIITYSETKKKRHGDGLVNKVINSHPFQLHIPGYQYCGPGTKLIKRLARSDTGINPLDTACKEDDMAHSKNRENVAARNSADKTFS